MKIFVFLLILFVTKINGRAPDSNSDRIQKASDHFRDVCDSEPDEQNLDKLKSCVANNLQDEECVLNVCKASKVRSLINGYREVVCNDQFKEETSMKINDCFKNYPEELKTKVRTCLGVKGLGTLREMYHDIQCNVHMQDCAETVYREYSFENWFKFDDSKQSISCVRQLSVNPKEINSVINSYKEVVCNRNISDGSLEQIKGCVKRYPKGLKDKVQTCLGLKGPGTLRQMFIDSHCNSDVSGCVASAHEDYALEHGIFYRTARQVTECIRQLF